MKIFEYKVVYGPYGIGEHDINKLGEEGWELVNANGGNYTQSLALYFKREKVV